MPAQETDPIACPLVPAAAGVKAVAAEPLRLLIPMNHRHHKRQVPMQARPQSGPGVVWKMESRGLGRA